MRTGKLITVAICCAFLIGALSPLVWGSSEEEGEFHQAFADFYSQIVGVSVSHSWLTEERMDRHEEFVKDYSAIEELFISLEIDYRYWDAARDVLKKSVEIYSADSGYDVIRESVEILNGIQRLVWNDVTLLSLPPLQGDVLDQDEDGLPDSVEEEGWDVSVVDGEWHTTYHVTSDPYRKDTDDNYIPIVLLC